jgi:hypothetical protein
MNHRGFGAVEFLVALVLGAIVLAGVFRLLWGHQRLFREHAERAEENATDREAFLILRSELAALGAGADGADLARLSPSAVEYRAFRSLGFLCGNPDPATLELTLDAVWYGLRAADESVDSLLVFADGTIANSDDDRWVPANLVSASRGNDCPGGRGSVTFTLAGVSGRELSRVHRGAPVRSFAVWETRSYRDRRGDWWVGMRRYRKSAGRWPAIQPVLGPLAPGGFVIEFFDERGRVVGDPGAVALLGVEATPRQGLRGATVRPLRFLVALRNR